MVASWSWPPRSSEAVPRGQNVRRTYALLALVAAMWITGCAGLEKEEYFVCPYDTVWDAAVETMKDRPVVRKDKDGGVIETAWTEMAANGHGFGMFQRELFDSKERARMLVELKRLDSVTKVT